MTKLRGFAATVVFSIGLFGARMSFAQPPSGDFTQFTTVKRPNRTLGATGIGVFALSYGPSVIVAAMSDRDADRSLFIPVVGPWLDLGGRGCNDAHPCGNQEDLEKAMLITSGVAQGVGLLLGIGSFLFPESTTRIEPSAALKPSVTFAPVSYPSGAGASAALRF